MRKIYFGMLLCLAVVGMVQTPANAQLKEGDIAPDWTLTDINGVEWNLYTLLNEGKSVFLDFSAVWCGPGWSYHTGGNLETLYETYGPDGSDEVMVFYIEGDGGSTIDQMNGIGGGTQGNWVAGTPYPMILTHVGDESYNVVSDYEIGYFPTIYRVCPNRIIKEVGQAPVATLYNSINSCEVAFTNNDPGIFEYTGPTSGCSTAELTVTIQNLGFNDLTAFTIAAYDGATELVSYDWSGDLALYEFADINLGDITLADDDNDIEIKIISADENDDNNSVTANISYENNVSMIVHLEIKTDNYPTQMRWDIIDEETGDELYDGGPYSTADKNEIVFDEDITLPGLGCYGFNFYDNAGDGITGSGYYELTDAAGNMLSDGDENVGFKKSASLKVTGLTAVDDVTVINADKAFPNPADANVTYTLSLNNNADVNINVVDIFGRTIDVITNSSMLTGEHNFTVDVTDYANGIYFIQSTINGKTESTKIVVLH
ncbi:MAG: T9SS type A sorting domain-containing protein [Bacteroidetes bacterium]|nr:T9SS type A sorting domain-containing protein [Bacteroidota bacterium]